MEYGNVPVFNHQKALIRYLKSKKVKVFIVTASVKWAVEGAAFLVGLKPDDVIGITSLGELLWDEYNVWVLENGTTITLWFRIDDSAAVEPRNRVAIEVIVGATGGDISLN